MLEHQGCCLARFVFGILTRQQRGLHCGRVCALIGSRRAPVHRTALGLSLGHQAQHQVRLGARGNRIPSAHPHPGLVWQVKQGIAAPPF